MMIMNHDGIVGDTNEPPMEIYKGHLRERSFHRGPTLQQHPHQQHQQQQLPSINHPHSQSPQQQQLLTPIHPSRSKSPIPYQSSSIRTSLSSSRLSVENHNNVSTHRSNASLVFDDMNETTPKRSPMNNILRKTSTTFQLKHSNPLKKKSFNEMYQHNHGSDDNLDLMPTLAMGYENSISKRLQQTNGELRITGDGYFFDRQFSESVSNPESYSSDRDYAPDHHDGLPPPSQSETNYDEVYLMPDPSDEDLKQMAYNSRRNEREHRVSSQPDDAIKNMQFISSDTKTSLTDTVSKSMPQNESVSPDSRYRIASTSNTIDDEATACVSHSTKGKKKASGLMKKMFRINDKKKKIGQDHTVHGVFGSLDIPVETLQRSRTPQQCPDTSRLPHSDVQAQLLRDNDGLRLEESLYIARHQPSQPEENQELTVREQFGSDGGTDIEETGVVELMRNFPVISTVFRMIDQSTTLSPQSKALLKVGFLVMVLYEIQSVLEIIKEWFV